MGRRALIVDDNRALAEDLGDPPLIEERGLRVHLLQKPFSPDALLHALLKLGGDVA